ncbi:MAG: DUF4019 domain-containing protein [Casimicrobiaceae bacterium]
MSRTLRGAWRAISVAILAGGMALGWLGSPGAQDTRATQVQADARTWLGHADRLDGNATWKLAGAKFRNALTAEAWTKALRDTRSPLGATQQRAAVSTRFESTFPNVPAGDYALVQFRTAFERRSEGHETVTLEREADGTWRVIGYFIR